MNKRKRFLLNTNKHAQEIILRRINQNYFVTPKKKKGDAGMTCCTDVHKQFDKFANGKVQVGELPGWTHVHGKVAWYVYQGRYSELGSKGFNAFWKRFGEAKLEMNGPPGDVYVCSPDCHEKDKQAKMLTILWCPIK